MDYVAGKLTEEVYDEYTEIMLPKNSLINSFIAYSENDKLKIIELGISIMKGAHKKINSFNNRDWADKLQKVETEKETTISNLRDENEILQEKYRTTINVHKMDMKRVKEKIYEETNTIFSNEIERLKEQKEQLNGKISQFNEKLVDQQRHSFQDYNRRISDLRKEYEEKSVKMRGEFTKALDKQSEMVSNMQEHTNKQKQNSTIKGQSGEEWVRNELLRQCPTIEIIDTHKEKAFRVQSPIRFNYNNSSSKGFWVGVVPFFDWAELGKVKEKNSDGVPLDIPSLKRWNLGLRLLFGWNF